MSKAAEGEAKSARKPARKRWKKRLRLVTIVVLLFILALSATCLYLRTDAGLRQVVLPLTGRFIGCRIEAEKASLQGFSMLSAEGLSIRIPVDNSGAYMDVQSKSALLDWRGDGPALLDLQESTIKLNTWPSSGTKNAATQQPEPLQAVRRLPDFTATCVDLTLILPDPDPEAGVTLPTFRLPLVELSSIDGAVHLRSDSRVKTDGGMLWQFLARQRLNMDLAFTEENGSSVASGTVELSGRFRAETAELERLTTRLTYRISDSGPGTLNLEVNNAVNKMISLEALIGTDASGWDVDVQVLGHEQRMKVLKQRTFLHIREWRSKFSVVHDREKGAIRSEGNFAVPGISVTPAEENARELPPIVMSGTWSARGGGGELRWNLQALAQKGEDVLLEIASQYGTDSPLDRPVAVKVPATSLDTLKLYLEPFGLKLPRGTVEGTFTVDPASGGRRHLVGLSMQVKDLHEIPGVPDDISVTSNVRMQAQLEPGKEIRIETLSTKTRVFGAANRLLCSVGMELDRAATISLEDEVWRRAAKVDLDFDAAVSPMVADRFRKEPPQRRRDPSAMRFIGRLVVELEGDETYLRADLQGSHNDIRFLRGTAQAGFSRSLQLKYLDLPGIEISGSEAMLRDLLPDRPPEFERLSVAGIIRSRDNDYQASLKLKSLGIGGLPFLPSWLNCSALCQMTGEASQDLKKVNLADVRFTASAFESRRVEPSAQFTVELKRPLTWDLSKGAAGLGSSTLELSAACTQRLLGRLQNKPDFAIAPPEKLVLDATLTLTQDLVSGLRGGMTATGRLGKEKMLDGSINGQLAKNGQLQEINIKSLLVKCPPKLRNALPEIVPSWDEVLISGNYLVGERADQHKFSFSAKLKEVGDLVELPDWVRISGQVDGNGSVDWPNKMSISKVHLSGEAYPKGKIADGGKLTVKLVEPAVLQWSGTGVQDGLRVPDTVQTKSEIEFLAPAVFLARIGNRQTTSGASLRTTAQLDLGRKNGTNRASIKLQSVFGKEKVCDLVSGFALDDSRAIQELHVERLFVVRHPELARLAGRENVAPRWERADLTLKVVPDAKKDLRTTATGVVYGLQGVPGAPEWLTTSCKATAAGILAKDAGSMLVNRLDISSNSTAGRDKKGVELALKLQRPVRLRLGRQPQLVPGQGAAISITGAMPYAYLVRQFQPKDFTRKQGSVGVKGTISLTAQDAQVLGVAEIKADFDDRPGLDLKGNLDFAPNMTLLRGKLNGTLHFSEDARYLVSRDRCPTWDKLALEGKLATDNGGGRVDFEASVSAGKLAKIPGVPEWTRGRGSLTAKGALSDDWQKLTLKRGELILDMGDGKDIKQGRMKLTVHKPLLVDLTAPLRPARGVSGRVSLDISATAGYLSRLRGIKEKGNAKRVIALNTNLEIQEKGRAIQVAVHMQGADGARPIAEFRGQGECSRDWRLLSGEIATLNIQYSRTVMDLLPKDVLAAFNSFRLNGKLVAEKQDKVFKGQVAWDGVHPPQWLPKAWRLDTKGDFTLRLSKDDIVSLDALKLTGSARRGAGWQQQAKLTANLSAPIRWPLGGWNKKQPVFKSELTVDCSVEDLNGLLKKPLTTEAERMVLKARVTASSAKGAIQTSWAVQAVSGGDMQFLDVTGSGTVAPGTKGKLRKGEVVVKVLRPQLHLIKAFDLKGLPQWASASGSWKLTAMTDGYRGEAIADVEGMRRLPGLPDWMSVDAKLKFSSLLPLIGKRKLTALSLSCNAIDQERKVELAHLVASLKDGEEVLLPGKLSYRFWPLAVYDTKVTLRKSAFQRMACRPVDEKGVQDLVGTGTVTLSKSGQADGRLQITAGGRALGSLDPELRLSSKRQWKSWRVLCKTKEMPTPFLAMFIDSKLLPRYDEAEVDLTVSRQAKPGTLGVDLSVRGTNVRGGPLMIQKGAMALSAKGVWAVDDEENRLFGPAPVSVAWNKRPAGTFNSSIKTDEKGTEWSLTKIDVSIPQLLTILPRHLVAKDQWCTTGKLTGDIVGDVRGAKWRWKWNLAAQQAAFANQAGKVVVPAFGFKTDGMFRGKDLNPIIGEINLSGKEETDKLSIKLAWGNLGRFRSCPSVVRVEGGDVDLTNLWHVVRGRNRSWNAPLFKATRANLARAIDERPVPPLRNVFGWMPAQAELALLNFEYDIKIKSLRCGSAEFQEVNAKIGTGDDVIRIENLDLKTGKGALEIRGEIKLNEGKTNCRATAKLERLPITPFLEVLYPGSSTYTTGEINADLNVKGEGTGPLGAWSSTKGEGELTITSLKTRPIPQLKPIADGLQLKDLEQMAWTEVKSDVVIDDRFIRLPNLSAVRQGLVVSSSFGVRKDGWLEWGETTLAMPTSQWRQFQAKDARVVIGTDKAVLGTDGYYTIELPFTASGFPGDVKPKTLNLKAFTPFANSHLGKVLLGVTGTGKNK